ncbi:MAG: hypothetical protein SLAVMIC_00412 [uncultured marine phage]|uniref:Uncharacterized protein n=1 Tax=uncultured marine phage TaxID=707152 RepID=A0A8D9CF48_9VIRU|nr:MAG: hypothetical protein SLAVMIC_00412 [uncultured marine phage]
MSATTDKLVIPAIEDESFDNQFPDDIDMDFSQEDYDIKEIISENFRSKVNKRKIAIVGCVGMGKSTVSTLSASVTAILLASKGVEMSNLSFVVEEKDDEFYESQLERLKYEPQNLFCDTPLPKKKENNVHPFQKFMGSKKW